LQNSTVGILAQLHAIENAEQAFHFLNTGPRELDVGWMIYFHRFFEDTAAQLGLPGMPQFLRREDVAARYELLTGYRPRDLDFYTTYAALRFGIISIRTKRRAIHFGESTMPDAMWMISCRSVRLARKC
jgi:aminoglycoside phosphotransferase (APT) family kinase protein